jgi:hypothetical protein
MKSCEEKISKNEILTLEVIEKLKDKSFFLNSKFSSEQIIKFIVEKTEDKLRVNFLYKQNRAEKCVSVPYVVKSNSKNDTDFIDDHNISNVRERKMFHLMKEAIIIIKEHLMILVFSQHSIIIILSHKLQHL